MNLSLTDHNILSRYSEQILSQNDLSNLNPAMPGKSSISFAEFSDFMIKQKYQSQCLPNARQRGPEACYQSEFFWKWHKAHLLLTKKSIEEVKAR